MLQVAAYPAMPQCQSTFFKHFYLNFLFIWKVENRRETETDIDSESLTGSPHKCLRQPGQGPGEARHLELYRGLPLGCPGASY